MIKFYGYKKCGTSGKGEKALKKLGLEYDFIDITDNPPSRSELEKMVSQSGGSASRFFNTSGAEYRNLGLKDRVKSMNDDEIIELLASNGRLIKRPVVTSGEVTTVGYREDIFSRVWTA